MKFCSELENGTDLFAKEQSSGAEGEADSPVEEQYAIAVTKGNTELLDAINAVLAELLVKDASGKTEIEKMVMQHMGMN